MTRADILNMPRIADKLAKLQAVHTEHEARMDRWNAEAMAAQPKEASHERASKPSHKRRRKRQDKKVTPRGKVARPISSDGVVNEAGGETDQGRRVYPGEEEKVG